MPSKINLYSIKDKLADASYDPFFCANDKLAIRNCWATLQNPDLNLDPKYYQLYLLGSLDLETLQLIPNLTLVQDFKDFVEADLLNGGTSHAES